MGQPPVPSKTAAQHSLPSSVCVCCYSKISHKQAIKCTPTYSNRHGLTHPPFWHGRRRMHTNMSSVQMLVWLVLVLIPVQLLSKAIPLPGSPQTIKAFVNKPQKLFSWLITARSLQRFTTQNMNLGWKQQDRRGKFLFAFYIWSKPLWRDPLPTTEFFERLLLIMKGLNVSPAHRWRGRDAIISCKMDKPKHAGSHELNCAAVNKSPADWEHFLQCICRRSLTRNSCC